MKKGVKFLAIFSLLLLIGFVSASYSIGEPEYSFSNTYGPNSTFSAWFNMSFYEEPLDSIFLDSMGNTITLKDLLETGMNSNYDYSCDKEGCESVYISENPSTEKSFSINLGEEKLLGFKFTGIIEGFNSAEFQITSNAGPSCDNQLKIDLFNDDVFDTGNTKKSTQTCENKDYGCFSQSEPSDEVVLGSTPFCQRFTLNEAPGFNLGAWIKETTAGTKKVLMRLYSDKGILLDNCEISGVDISSQGGEASCEVDYLIKESDEYYVCILSGDGSGEYKIRGYSPIENSCGFLGVPIKTELNAYHIFVEKLKFDSIGTLTVQDDFGGGISFAQKLEEYILNEYGDLDCSQSCLVPMSLVANTTQNVVVKNLKINYDKVGLPGAEEKNFYDFNLDASKINSSFQKLYLDPAEFTLPESFGDYDYKISYKGEEIFNEEISIENISIDISPKVLPIIFETEITANVEAPYEILEYLWNFGDGVEEITTTNTVSHAYTLEGEYTLTLQLTDENDNVFSKSFYVLANSSEEIIEGRIEELRERISSLELELLGMDSFTRDRIKEYLEIDSIKSILNSIESNLTVSGTTQDYVQYIQPLLEINLPTDILTVPTSRISYYPSESLIDLDVLEKIQGEIYSKGDEESYRRGILAWYQNNIESKITLTDISFVMDSGVVPGFKIFNLEISQLNPVADSDLVIGDLMGLKFSQNHSEELIDGYKTFKLGNTNNLKFSTTEEIAFQNLPLFISPKLSSVFTTETPTFEPERDWKPVILIAFFILLVALAIFAYFSIHKWYKKRYESHLFPRKNNLYNMVNYVNNSKDKGLNNSEIRKNLKKVGWTGEQINYVMKKYAGEDVGMPGLSNSNNFQTKSNPVKNFSEKNPSQAKTSNFEFKKRSPFLILILFMITFGIYSLFWFFSTTKEIRKAGQSLPNLIMLFIPIANIIFYWKYSEALGKITNKNEVGTFMLLLFLFPIGMMVAQSKLNNIGQNLNK